MKRAPSISILVIAAFLVNTFGPMPVAQADEFRLPAPGVMVSLSPPLDPPILKGLKVHPDNPFRFDFILDQGDALSPDLKQEATKLIKYFLASLTVPEKDLWVNLSPYEKDRIIPRSFGLTEMGRDLLAQDYILKQITASLIYPEGETGRKFWARVYQEAAKKFGTTNIPVNTFNKVWIVPEKAVVYENAAAGTAYVVESRLKVMLEQDYLSMQKHADVGGAEGGASPASAGFGEHAGETRGQDPNVNALGSQIVREIVIPELTKEINEDKNFAQIRQVYNSLILATWYKKKIKDSILSQVYADKNKTAGVGYSDFPPQLIYQRYLQAFKKGVFNYIKEESDPITQETIPRKYFSGGVDFAMTSNTTMKGIDGVMDITHGQAALQDIPFYPGRLVKVSAGVTGLNIDKAAIASEPQAEFFEQALNIDGTQSTLNQVKSLQFAPTDQIKEATFFYDHWGQINGITLVKGPADGESPNARVRLDDSRELDFSYRDGVPYISLVQDGHTWVFSGYWLTERAEDGIENKSYVTIKSFGGKYPALESDNHAAMYFFLRVLHRRHPIDLMVNFDLHHDNYFNAEMDQNVTFANWVRKAKDMKYVGSVTWVYPSWYTPDSEVENNARRFNTVNNITNNYLSTVFTGNTVATFDFDGLVSSTAMPQIHSAGKEEIDAEINRMIDHVGEQKEHLAGINFNRSALSDFQKYNYSPQDPSNYILNAFVSKTQELLGNVSLVKIKQPASPLAPFLEIHNDAAMAANVPALTKSEDIVEAQRVVQEISEKANVLYGRRNGPFVIQQYIPLQYREPGVEALQPADIHGGEALWLLMRQLVESPVFQSHYQFSSFNQRTDYKQQLINLFYSRQWISLQERNLLRQYIKDLDALLSPYLKTASFDRQGMLTIADRNIRTSAEHPQAPDVFYRQYYEKTQFIDDILTRMLTKIVNQALPAAYGQTTPLANGFVLRELQQGFYIDSEDNFHFKLKGEGNAVLILDLPGGNAERVFNTHPELLVRVFQWAAEHDAVLPDKLLMAMAKSVSGLHEFGYDTRAAFMELLESPSKISLMLLKMYQIGLLGKFFPEFDELKYHFEVPSHRFSVPVHTIYLFYFLEHLAEKHVPSNIYEETIKTYDYVAHNQGGINLAILRMGIFFHDLQKQNEREEYSEPHPILGALNLVPRALKPFTVSHDFRSRVQWLVWHHQELADRTGSQVFDSDLIDLLDLGKDILDEDLWDVFYLLSVADANSVDPYNTTFVESGKQDTMLEMFHMLLKYFQSQPADQRALREQWEDKAKTESGAFLGNAKRVLMRAGFTDESRIDLFLSMFPPYYFRTIGNPNMIAQFRMFDQVMSESAPSPQVRSIVFSSKTPHGPMFEVVVGSNQKVPGTVYKISGVLAALGFNIWDAKINTTPGGEVFNRFRGYFLPLDPTADTDYWHALTGFVTQKIIQLAIRQHINVQAQEFAPFAGLEENPELGRNQVLPALIKLVLEGYVSVDDIFAFNKSFNSFKRLTILGEQMTYVSFEKQAADEPYTVLDLHADDRPGLLYMVSRILSQRFKLNIQAAPISTFQKGLVDKFVLSAEGHPLNAAQREAIASFLEIFLYQDEITNDMIIAAAQGKDLAMNGGQTQSAHVSLLTSFLRNLAVRNDSLVTSPGETNILRKFFQGESVLNIGPEDHTLTGLLNEENVMTALRTQGIEAVALSPAKPPAQWPQGSFVQGQVQDMPIEDNKFDNIVIVSLFEPYYWSTVINRNKSPGEIEAMYPVIAKELRRVLKNNGRFFLINYSGNTGLIDALRAEGFETVFSNSEVDGGVFINHKDNAQVSRVWKTTAIEDHDFRNFTYTVKMAWPGRLLDPRLNSGPFYSASVIDQDNVATYTDMRIGLVLEFPDKDVRLVLKHMAHDIAPQMKTAAGLTQFIHEHKTFNPGNVLFERTSSDQPLNITPEELVRQSQGPRAAAYAANSEIVINNTPDLKVKAVILLAKDNIKMATTLSFINGTGLYEDIYKAIQGGLPVVIAGDAQADINVAREAFLQKFPEAREISNMRFVVGPKDQVMPSELLSLADPDPGIRKRAAAEIWDRHFGDDFRAVMEKLIDNFIDPAVGLNQDASRRDARAATLYTLELGIAHNKVYLRGEGLTDFQKGLAQRLEREAENWMHRNPDVSGINSRFLANGTSAEIKLLEEYKSGHQAAYIPREYALLENLRLLMLARKNKQDLDIHGIDFVPESIINLISAGNFKQMDPIVTKMILLRDNAQLSQLPIKVDGLPEFHGFYFPRGSRFGSGFNWMAGNFYPVKKSRAAVRLIRRLAGRGPNFEGHNGVDFIKYIAQNGEVKDIPSELPVVAIDGGTVLQGREQNNDQVIIKTSDNKFVIYAHIHPLVLRGARVNKGDQLGILGGTLGNPLDVIHLHLEVLDNNQSPVDPFNVYPALRHNAGIERDDTIDKAMRGGIDLTSESALTVQNSGQGIRFHLDPAQLLQLQNSPGFVPVIITIKPVTDLKGFLSAV